MPHKIKKISFKIIYPDVPAWDIVTRIEGGETCDFILTYPLEGKELDPDYLTTDRLYERLSEFYKSYNIVEFESLLDDFVVEFVTALCKGNSSENWTNMFDILPDENVEVFIKTDDGDTVRAKMFVDSINKAVYFEETETCSQYTFPNDTFLWREINES